MGVLALWTSVRQQTRDLQFHGKIVSIFSILGPTLKISLVI